LKSKTGFGFRFWYSHNCVWFVRTIHCKAGYDVPKAGITFMRHAASVTVCCLSPLQKLHQNTVNCTLTLNFRTISYESRTWDTSGWFWDGPGETGMFPNHILWLLVCYSLCVTANILTICWRTSDSKLKFLGDPL